MIKILNYDGNEKYSKSKDIKSLEEFIHLLKKSPGIKNKPVRLIQDLQTQKILVVKFSFGLDNRCVPLNDEYNNLKELCRNNLNVQISKLVWNSKKENEYHVMCTEYIPPFSINLHNMRDLVKTANENLWKEAFFQVLFTLFILQKKYKGFRHNDLKSDNVLITTTTTKTPQIYCVDSLQMRRTWQCQLGIEIKIIDFELCYCENGKLNSKMIDKDIGFDYGLYSLNCNLFDIHLFIVDAILVSVNNENNKLLIQNLKDFISNFIPLHFFEKENLTLEYRLKKEDQLKLNVENGLLDLLIHPYFHNLRNDNFVIGSSINCCTLNNTNYINLND